MDDQGYCKKIWNWKRRNAGSCFPQILTTQLANSKVNPEIREMLLGHKIGLASSYYKSTSDEMMSEYEKTIDNLTIDLANRLQRKVETLTIEKSRLDILEAKYQQLEQRTRRCELIKITQCYSTYVDLDTDMCNCGHPKSDHQHLISRVRRYPCRKCTCPDFRKR
jgi:hypothetical protein